MRLDTIALKGVTRFAALTLDIRDLPPGLIAIIGENGAGKTTLLESPFAALYRTFPSRGGRPLVDYATGRDSAIDVAFSFDGRGAYRARVALDAIARQTEAVIEQLGADGLSMALTDGKVSTFDAWVKEHLPPADLLLASVFAAQNRAGSFITADRKARKDLFAALLALTRYEEMATVARQAAALVEQARTKAGGMRSALLPLTDPAVGERLHADANRLQMYLSGIEVRLRELTTEREQAEAAQADVTGRLAAYTEAVAVANEATAQARACQQLVTREQRAERDADEELARDLQTIRTTAHHKIADLTKRIAANEGLIAEAARIRQAEAADRDAAQSLVDAEAALAAAQRDVQAAMEKTRQLDKVVSDQTAALRVAQEQLARADREIARLADVPCHAEGSFASCAFIASAVEARSARAGLVDGAGRHVDTSALCAATLEGDAAKAEVLARRGEVQVLTQQRADLAPWLKKVAPLAAAEARLLELQTQLAATSTDQETAEAARRQRHAEVVATARAHAREASDALAVAQRTAFDASQRVRDLEPVVAESARVTQALAMLRRLETEASVTRARLQSEADHLHRARTSYTETCAQRARVETWLRALDDELLTWQVLARALGRDGLPKLEIDAAGPTVSAYCNDLLTACFGSRFSVELITEEAKTSGKGMKETFDIRVFDNERGGWRDIADLSGGEQVIVDEALKNAIAIFANTRATQPIRTCWRDETTGPLDPENAQRYVAMLRRLRELAGFHHVFFVSHNPDAWAQADARLVVAGGGVTVQ